MAELKLCPLCGDVPHLDRHEIFCDCGLKLQIDDFRYQVMDNGLYPTYEEAKHMMVEAWNRRVNEDTVCGAWQSCWNDLKNRRCNRE